MDLPTMRQVIQEFGLLQNKKFSKNHGQNFLLDLNITRKICKSNPDIENNIIIEVGPGPGGLTRAILERSPKKLYAIEVDEKCVAAQKPLLDTYPNYQVIQQDALTFDFPALFAEHKDSQIHIIANLPYNIGTKLYINWLKGAIKPTSLTLMFQKEVVDRITANKGQTAYGRLALLTQYLAHAKLCFVLPPSAFTPAPKVESAVVRVVPKQIPDEVRQLFPSFEKITSLAFQQRRKMLRASLKSIFNQNDFTNLHIEPTQRPEQLDFDEFYRMARYFSVRK